VERLPRLRGFVSVERAEFAIDPRELSFKHSLLIEDFSRSLEDGSVDAFEHVTPPLESVAPGEVSVQHGAGANPHLDNSASILR